MGERRSNRGVIRTDRQVLAHVDDMFWLSEIARGRVLVGRDNSMTLRRLAREDLCLAGFAAGTTPTLLPRGQRLLAVARGEIAPPLDD